MVELILTPFWIGLVTILFREKRRRVNESKTDKVLLLIDNGPSHPPLEELNAIRPDFVRVFITTCCSTCPALDQGVTEKLKTMYNKNSSVTC